jgi:single-strand DNA-binding protein
MYHRTEIIGNLGADPELRYLSDGTPVCSFSVAVNESWPDANGQKQTRTTWYRVSAWRRLAETCASYLSKGRLVHVEGKMQTPRPYEGRDGEWRASLDLRADRVLFLGGANGQQAQREESRDEGLEPGVEPLDTPDEDEIPF